MVLLADPIVVILFSLACMCCMVLMICVCFLLGTLLCY